MRRRNWTVPYALFLIIFVVMPLLLIVVYAFTDAEGAFTFANFRKFMMHPESINTFVYSIGIAVITTLVCLLLGYPAAYILSQKRFNTSQTMVVLFILPMWVNILIRTLATVALFDFLNLPLGEGAFGIRYGLHPYSHSISSCFFPLLFSAYISTLPEAPEPPEPLSVHVISVLATVAVTFSPFIVRL